MDKNLELKKKFNELESDVFTYIRSLHESIAIREEEIKVLTNKLNNLQNEIEKYKRKERASKVILDTSQKDTSAAIDTENSSQSVSSLIKPIDKYFDISKLKDGITTIKKYKENCPICGG